MQNTGESCHTQYLGGIIAYIPDYIHQHTAVCISLINYKAVKILREWFSEASEAIVQNTGERNIYAFKLVHELVNTSFNNICI